MLVPLNLEDGLYKQGTVYEAKNRWYDAQLVRFLEDTVRPIGGWTRLSESLQASLYAQDLFTADPGDISADFSTDGYISDLEFAGWNVEDPTTAELEPDPSTHLAFPLDPSAGDYGFRSVDAIEFSDFSAFIDVKWQGDPVSNTGVGMLVRGNSTYHDDAGGEALLFQMDIVTTVVPETAIILDTFSYAGPGTTPLSTWTADTGETYPTGPFNLVVNSALSSPTGAGVLEQNAPTSQGNFAIQSTGGSMQSVGDEIFCDFYRPTTAGTAYLLWLYWMTGAGGSSATEHMSMWITHDSSGNASINSRRQYSGGSVASGTIGGVWSYTPDTWMRYGVTILSGNGFEYWSEPAGGGTRTSLATWSWVYDANYDFTDDPTKLYIGCGCSVTNWVFGQTPMFDNLTLHGASGYTDAVLDTFVEASTPLDLNNHIADTGETWDVALQFGSIPQWVVDPSGSALINFSTGTALYCMQDGGGAALDAYGEAYCDMWRGTGHVGGGTYVGFYFQVGTGGRAATEYSYVLVEFSSVQINAHRRYGGGSDNYLGAGAAIEGGWDYETFKRIGVTVVDADTYTFWTEDYGGGNRIIYDTWTPTPGVQSAPLGDANYGRMGMMVDGTNFIVGTDPSWENLTMRNRTVTSLTTFRYKASRVYNGVLYDLSADGGWTVAEDYPFVTDDDFTDGIRMGVDIEGDEAKAWYEGFESTSSRVYLDWDGFAAGDPLDLTYENPGGVTDDYNDGSHQYAGIYREDGDITATAGTEIYQYAYQRLDFTGPFTLEGIPRGAAGWEKAARGYLAFGTTEKLYEYSVGYLYDITPAGFTVGAENSTTSSDASGRYGTGTYGQLTYGVGQQGIVEQFDADIWHLDTFGSWLLGCMNPSDDVMYVWQPENGGEVPAEAITIANGWTEDAPSATRGLVVTPERFTVCLGKDGDSRLVAWSDRETIDVWAPTVSNEAGEFLLEGSGRLMRGMRGRGETVLWTDTDCWVMTYIAGEYVYGFEKRGTNCGLIAPLAVGGIDTGFVWWSQRGFYVYDGYAKPLECPVQDYVFTDLDQLQRVKINAVVNQLFGEVWWFYPSQEQDPGECDKYVVWNYRENTWTVGNLARTCGVEASASTKNLMMLSPNGYAYVHEQGWEHFDIDGVTELVPYIESGPLEFGEGEQVYMATQFIPDEKNLGDVVAYFYTSFYPMEDEVQHGPYTMNVEQDVRLTARQMRVRLEQNVADDWRVGVFRFESEVGGRR